MRTQSKKESSALNRKLAAIAIASAGIFGGLVALLLAFTAQAGSSSRAVRVGQSAPPFSLKDQSGRLHSLVDYSGRPVVVLFLPDDAGEATQELRSLKDRIRSFDSAGAKVFGVNTDGPDANRALHDREALPFPLLSDPAGVVAARYNAGAGGKIVNAADVIDPTGTLMVSLPEDKIHPHEVGKQVLDAAQCCFVPTRITVSRLMDDVAPDFKLPRVDGKGDETLYGDNHQQATVVIFTSAWCPCATGYDDRINALARRYAGKVRVIEVNSSADETVQQIEAHAKSAGIVTPVVKDANNLVADSMNAHVTPESFVMDARHVLRYQGRIDDDRSGKDVKSPDLQHAIDAILAGKKPPVRHTNGLGCAIVRVKPITSGGA